MTQQEMIETIQESFSDAGETKIRLMLNRAMDEFIGDTMMLSGYGTVDITADQRYYDFSDLSSITTSNDVLGVYQVDYDNAPIDRFIGQVKDSDENEG